VMQKEGIPGERKEPKKKERKKEKPDPRSALVREFLEETLVSLPEETVMFREESVYLVPSHPLEERDLVSPGVLVGTVQKGRVIPHHRFFLAYANDFRSKTVLTGEDPRVGAYLSGEEIPVEGEGGWSVVFYHRCPLGGIKISQGRGKNYYPKGLRKAVASDGEGYV